MRLALHYMYLSIALAWQTEVEDTVQRAVHHDHTAERLKEIYEKCTKISTDHKAELGHVVKTATNALIQHEVRQKESRVVEPLTLRQQQQQHHTPGKERN